MWQDLYAVDVMITLCGNSSVDKAFIPVTTEQFVVQGFVGGCMSGYGYDVRPRTLPQTNCSVQGYTST